MRRRIRRAAVVSGVATCAVAITAGCGAGAVNHAQTSAAARYMAIAEPANRRLETDFDGLDRYDHSDLARAQAALRDAAATERRFDRQLLALRLPAAEQRTARLLTAANEARARLTAAAAGARSLTQLRADEPRLTAANAPVEEAVRVIRSQLGLPPPQTS